MNRLPDWVFYPLAVLAVIAMIFGALTFGETNYRTADEILSDGLMYTDDDLGGIVTGNGLTSDVLETNSDIFLRVSASRGPLDGIQSAGAFFALSLEEILALQGYRVRIQFEARTASLEGAEGARFSFFTQDIGQSSWRRTQLNEQFQTFEFDVTPPHCQWDYAYIGAWPDWATQKNKIDIRSVRLEVLEPMDCPT